MSIASEITRLQGAKAALKTAIEGKGVEVSSDAKLDAYAALVDDIQQGGGGAAAEGDVTFYDYDGTIVASYSKSDFAALTELPANPDRTAEGLTAQGWNWTLAGAKTYVAKYGKLNIGQSYVPTDGKTKIHIHIADTSQAMSLCFSVLNDGSATIDWGDGSEIETATGTSYTTHTHTYSQKGDYIISVGASSGSISFGGGSSYSIYGTDQQANRDRIKKAFIGNDVSVLYSNTFKDCYGLESVVVASGGPTYIGEATFINCRALRVVVLPIGITGIRNTAFSACSALELPLLPEGLETIGISSFASCAALRGITIPGSVTSIGNYAFSGCYGMKSITLPDAVLTIGTYAFQNCSSMEAFVIYATTPPELGSSAFSGTPTDFLIFVPENYRFTYIGTLGWLDYRTKIFAIPS